MSAELRANAVGDVRIEAGEREFTPTRAADAHERTVERRFRGRSKSSVETTTRAASIETTPIAHTSPLDAAAAGDVAVERRQRPTAAAVTTRTTAAAAAITPHILSSDSPVPPPLSTVAVALVTRDTRSTDGGALRSRSTSVAEAAASTIELRASHDDRDKRADISACKRMKYIAHNFSYNAEANNKIFDDNFAYKTKTKKNRQTRARVNIGATDAKL